MSPGSATGGWGSAQIELTSDEGRRYRGWVEIQLAMVVLEVRDLHAATEFYRRLGLDVPPPI
jgi:hypothetical protein